MKVFLLFVYLFVNGNLVLICMSSTDITVFPKVENLCLTLGQASKKICQTEKYEKNLGQFSFCTMQHTCITPQYLQNIN